MLWLEPQWAEDGLMVCCKLMVFAFMGKWDFKFALEIIAKESNSFKFFLFSFCS